MGKPASHGVPRHPLATTAATPTVGTNHTTGQHGTIGLKALPDGFQTKVIETAERGHVRASEGSVRQVEVFRWAASELPSTEDLDSYPMIDAPRVPTASTVKSPLTYLTTTRSTGRRTVWRVFWIPSRSPEFAALAGTIEPLEPLEAAWN
jgi:hypothetical protein